MSLVPEWPRLGVHGFGRIGRAIIRASLSQRRAYVCAINEKHPDDANLLYLLKYDSVYGRLSHKIAHDGPVWVVGDMVMTRHDATNIDDVPWAAAGAEVVIDASGQGSRRQYERVLRSGIRVVLVTRQFEQADRTCIPGVDDHVDGPLSGVVSTSTCDANALALVMDKLRPFGPGEGSVTTLHPWLGEQALLDRPAASGVPAEYGLGRSAPVNLIPKSTSAARAAATVVPEAALLYAMSFRTPTHSVSCLDLTLRLTGAADRLSTRELNQLYLRSSTERSPLQYSTDPLVSSDLVGTSAGAVVDGRWTRRLSRDLFKVVAWYDNEFGYASQVLRAAQRTCGAAYE